MYKINKRGQSTVEYVLLVAAVIAVMIAFATGNKSGSFQNELSGTLSDAAGQMSNMSGRLAGSEAGTNGSSAASTYTVNAATQ
jgi:Flp pilus assembly pilin Flp